MLILLALSIGSTYCTKIALYLISKKWWLKRGKSKYIILWRKITDRVFFVVWTFGVFWITKDNSKESLIRNFIGENNLGVSDKIIFLIAALLLGIVIDILIIKGGTLKTLGHNNELEYNSINGYDVDLEEMRLAMDSLALVLQNIEDEIELVNSRIKENGLEREISKIIIEKFRLYFDEAGKEVFVIKKGFLPPELCNDEIVETLTKETLYTQQEGNQSVSIIKAHSGYYIFKYSSDSMCHYDWQNIHIIQNFCILISIIVTK